METSPEKSTGRIRRIRTWIGRRWLTGPGWLGASIGVAVLALIVWFVMVLDRKIPGDPMLTAQLNLPTLLIVIGAGLVTLLVLTLVARLFSRRFPAPFLAVAVGAGVLLGTMSPGPSPIGWAIFAALTILTGAFVGGWIASVLSSSGSRPGRARTIVSAAVAALALVVAVGMVYPGGGTSAAAPERTGTAEFDPSQPGEFEVRTFTYGGGEGWPDRYGSDVDVVADTVDASEQLPEWVQGSTRATRWGYDATALPLNATVWAPQEDGEFPLVLIVHGNTQLADSELGFGYLAEHLASRGYVVASIDQSYLNTGLIDSSGGLAQGNAARARIVIEHLAQWARWAQDGEESIPQVDLENVALIGHSRGGEAVTVAAAVAGGGLTPGWPVAELPGVAVQSVVAIAPSGGLVVSDPLRLTDVDYLTLAGTHDADISSFAGIRQYARTTAAPGGFTAAVLIHRANHTQFNTGWGRHDSGLGLASRVLNTGVLITPEEQQRATVGFVTAFLQAGVQEDDAARALFTEPLPDADWLPPSEVRRSSSVVSDTSARETFGQIEAGDLSVAGASAEVTTVPSRSGHTGNRALLLSSAEGEASVEVPLPDGTAGSRIVLDAADAAEVGSRGEEPITIDVTATDSSGGQGSCELPDLRPTLEAQLGKLGLLMPLPAGEPFLSTLAAPTSCLAETDVDPEDIVSLTVQVGGAGDGGVYLDNVGLTD